MTVLFHGNVLEYTLGEERLEAEGAQCVRTIIELLGERFGEEFREFLLGEDTCFFLINGNGLMAAGGMDAPLQAGDIVEVVPFVEGG